MDPTPDPWFLVQQHGYTDAIAIYLSRLQRGYGDAVLYSELGTAYLCMEVPDLAGECFLQANALAAVELPAQLGKTDDHLLWLGASLLIEGETAQAVSRFRSAVQGILDGSITRSDMAGGASAGLLLRYAADVSSEGKLRAELIGT